jgi:hypothetical protein
MLARAVSIKVALVLIIAALGAATAFASTTSGDRPQRKATENAPAGAGGTGPTFRMHPVQPDEVGGEEAGERGDAPTVTTGDAANAKTLRPTRRAEASNGGAGNGAATGPDATEQASFGLCQAFADTNQPVDVRNGEGSVAYRNLAEAAAAAGQSVADFCEDVPSPSAGEERQRANHGAASSEPNDIPPTAPDADRSDVRGPNSPPESRDGSNAPRP